MTATKTRLAAELRAVAGDVMMLIFVSPDGGFNVFTVDANMTACLVAGGTNFKVITGEPA